MLNNMIKKFKQGDRVIYIGREFDFYYNKTGTIYDYIYYIKILKKDKNYFYRELELGYSVLVLFDEYKGTGGYEPFWVIKKRDLGFIK